MRVLITGGAGFVGSFLARRFRRDDPDTEVVAFDNLRRRGSEMNVPLLQGAGARFVHGDIRCPDDLEDLPGAFDLLIEASAEPSVLAGLGGSPQYVLQTNLTGTVNCLEWARRRGVGVIFLSTSRVYSIAPLRDLALRETDTRFEIAPEQKWPGVTERGIDETFPTHLARSLYGATKLASEMLLQEYVHTYGLRGVINRCGVIAGPGQFGKVDQGVFTLWVARHLFGKPLRYTGFGGTGKQVRDLLHPEDLYRLIRMQMAALPEAAGEAYNVGGGAGCSVSLAELTALCREVTGATVPVASDPTTTSVDIPLYLSDCARVEGAYGWRPEKTARDIMSDTAGWLEGNADRLRPLFG